MKKIVAIIQPFDRKQTMHVFENGNLIDKIESETVNVPKDISNLCHKHMITDISFKGPAQFSRGLVKKMEEYEKLQYSNPIEKKIKYF